MLAELLAEPADADDDAADAGEASAPGSIRSPAVSMAGKANLYVLRIFVSFGR